MTLGAVARRQGIEIKVATVTGDDGHYHFSAVRVGATTPTAVRGARWGVAAVNIVSAQARDVLAVPLSALVALAGGGYAVDVVQGGTAHLVAVQTGLFAQDLVQVSGPGLTAGQRVQVPAS